MRVVFFGTPQFAVPTLERLLEHPGFEVLAVITQPDKRRGRGNQFLPSPVKTVALSHDLPVWQPRRIKRDSETLDQLRATQSDCFVVVAYGQILSQKILEMPRLGCVNVHGSLLPRYRGAAPIQWCLYNGESTTGITTMLMDAGMDTGPMLLKATVPIGLLDTAQDLAPILASVGADRLIQTLLKLERQELHPTPQDSAQATYAPPIQKQDYDLDWSRSAIALHNQVRGLVPNCVARFREQDLKIMAAAPIGPNYWSALPPDLKPLEQEWPALSSTAESPGTVVSLFKGIGPILQTGKGLLLLRQVQLPGKRPQSGWDFVNGTRLRVGEQLGNGS